MKSRKIVVSQPSCLQLRLPLAADRMSGLTPIERDRVKSALARVLLQAAGVVDGEIDDDQR
jgi:hypothetical protein